MKRLVKTACHAWLSGTRNKLLSAASLEPGYSVRLEFADVVRRRMFESGQELTFIQIGAFDGITRIPSKNTSRPMAGGVF